MQVHKKIGHKLLHGKGVFMFLRSMVTSQISTYVDFCVSFVLYMAIHLSAAVSAMFGAMAGGIVNCIVNYKFTFRMRECSYFAIGIKFFLVWIGSLLLNTFGTELLDVLLTRSQLLEALGFSRNIIFSVARVATSLLVSVFWNFLLQRYFVFRPTPFDNFIDRIYYYLHAHSDHR